ncbi:MutS-related protein [Chishuiella changwenlii]|uniref:MutS-related protein n=1 Tax=Chishuiella changwenlii TaxID=1434701 RepID=UPI002FDA9DAB
MNQYNSIEEKLNQDFSLLKSKKNKLSNIRFSLFFVSLILFLIYVTTSNNLLLGLAIILFVIFLFFVVKASKVNTQLTYITQALEIISEIKSTTKVDSFPEDNADFNNVYNKDLDILEGNSIFNRLNKTQTRIGSLQLKHFLSNLVLDEEEILERQKAFSEIGKKHEWIVKFLTFTKRLNMNQASVFIFENRVFHQQNVKYIPIVISVINVLTFIYLAIIGFPKEIVFYWILGAVAISFVINLIYKNKLRKVAAYTNLKADELVNLHEVFSHIEQENFEEKINKEAQHIFQKPQSSSALIKVISASKETLDASNFPLVGFILNTFFLWRLYYSIQFENDIQKTVTSIKPWLDELAKIEAFVSFAIFNDMHQNFTFPTIVNQPNQLEISNAFHPLLDENIAVKNSFETNRPNNIAIITGANMAGKSTFLRTVGCNLVLAMNGAKVSAEKMIFCPMDLFTSIRTVDNLSSGDSYFKNEINKLKILIDRLENNQPQFIILDEILKGTNSEDKLIGSQKFLEKLIKFPTHLTGFIATHDLELTKMEEDFPEHIINYSFELKNENNNYYSDYKLRKGTTKMMNAIFLMKQFKIID